MNTLRPTEEKLVDQAKYGEANTHKYGKPGMAYAYYLLLLMMTSQVRIRSVKHRSDVRQT
jgi:hypothetical protein